MNPSLLVLHPALALSEEQQKALRKLRHAWLMLAILGAFALGAIALTVLVVVDDASKAVINNTITMAVVVVLASAGAAYHEVLRPWRVVRELLARGSAFWMSPQMQVDYESIRQVINEHSSEERRLPLLTYLFCNAKLRSRVGQSLRPHWDDVLRDLRGDAIEP